MKITIKLYGWELWINKWNNNIKNGIRYYETIKTTDEKKEDEKILKHTYFIKKLTEWTLEWIQ